MAVKAGVFFTHNTLKANAAAMGPKLDLRLGALTHYHATRIESLMKSRAKWTDRTGNARQGLRAIPENRKGYHAILLTHSVPYGIYLETRWSGRYAIIIPTLQTEGPKFMASAQGVIGRLG